MSWRAIFFLNLPVAVGAVVVTLFAARESRDETVEHSIDLGGIATLTLGLAAIVLALVESNAWGWGSPRILVLLIGGIAGLVIFAVVERRSPMPTVDFGFFRSRSFLGANLVGFIVSFSMLAMFFFIALYMQNIQGYSPLGAGLRFLPSTVMIVLIAPVAGRLTDRIGPRSLMTGGLLAVAAALFWQSRLDLHSGYASLLPGFVLMGIGMGFTMSPMSTAAMNSVDSAKAGVASGTLSMSRMVGGTFGVGALVATVGRSQLDRLIPQVPSGKRAELAQVLGSGSLPSGGAVGHAVRQAFVAALSDGLLLSAGVALVGALVAATLISPITASARARAREPEPGAEVASGVPAGEPV